MSVNSLSFGQSLPGGGNSYLRIKQKGDMVQFKIAQEPVYTGKHFAETDGKWTVTECPRIAEREDCETCTKYFELMDMVKKFKAAENVDDENTEVKNMKKEARQYAVSIEFYFPILDRSDGKFKILQTTNGVRNKFNAQFEAGIAVMDKEWILRNTGSPSPAERYSLSPVDSADVKPLTPEEEEEFTKAKAYDLSQISQGGADDGDE